MRKNKKGGFTLVELVIVIAVIAILAAVLIPTFITVIDSANNSADLQLATNMNTVISTNFDDDVIALSDNLRKYLKENGITDIATKNDDMVIAYNKESKKFERINVKKTLENTDLLTIVSADDGDKRFETAPYSIEEIFKDEIIVSTKGNGLAEALYALHNIPSDIDNTYVETQMKKLNGYKGIAQKVADVVNKTLFIDNEGQPHQFVLTGSGDNWSVAEGESSPDRVVFNEECTIFYLDKLADENCANLTFVLPNTIEEISVSEESKEDINFFLDKFANGNNSFAGNVEALHQLIEEAVEDLEEGMENPYKNLEWNGTLNEVKNAAAEGLIKQANQPEFYVSETDLNGDYYYKTISIAIAEAQRAANYSHTEKKVILTDAVTPISTDITIPKNVTLSVPFYGNGTKYYTGSSDGYETANDDIGQFQASKSLVDDDLLGTTGNKKFTLNIDEGKKLTVYGKLEVGSVISYPAQNYQGHTSGYYGQVCNNGAIVVEDGGTIDIWGYIKGSGTVTANKGASVYEPFIVTDFTGGSNCVELYGCGQSPFLRYAMLNIQSELTINYGAKLLAHCNLRSSAGYFPTDEIVIGYGDNTSATKGLITLETDGAQAVCTYNYDANKKVVDANENNNLKGDIGRTSVTIKGGSARTEALSLLGIITTASVLFPVPFNFSFIIEEDAIFNIYNKYVLLPGSEMTVNGTLNITAGASFYVMDYLKQGAMMSGGKFYPTVEQLTEAKINTAAVFTVNGTMNVADSVGGKVTKVGGVVRTTAEANRATLNIGKGVDVSGVFDIGGIGSYDSNTSSYNFPLRVFDTATLEENGMEDFRENDKIIPAIVPAGCIYKSNNGVASLSESTTCSYYKKVSSLSQEDKTKDFGKQIIAAGGPYVNYPDGGTISFEASHGFVQTTGIDEQVDELKKLSGFKKTNSTTFKDAAELIEGYYKMSPAARKAAKSAGCSISEYNSDVVSNLFKSEESYKAVFDETAKAIEKALAATNARNDIDNYSKHITSLLSDEIKNKINSFNGQKEYTILFSVTFPTANSALQDDDAYLTSLTVNEKSINLQQNTVISGDTTTVYFLKDQAEGLEKEIKGYYNYNGNTFYNVDCGKTDAMGTLFYAAWNNYVKNVIATNEKINKVVFNIYDDFKLIKAGNLYQSEDKTTSLSIDQLLTLKEYDDVTINLNGKTMAIALGPIDLNNGSMIINGSATKNGGTLTICNGIFNAEYNPYYKVENPLDAVHGKAIQKEKGYMITSFGNLKLNNLILHPSHESTKGESIIINAVKSYMTKRHTVVSDISVKDVKISGGFTGIEVSGGKASFDGVQIDDAYCGIKLFESVVDNYDGIEIKNCEINSKTNAILCESDSLKIKIIDNCLLTTTKSYATGNAKCAALNITNSSSSSDLIVGGISNCRILGAVYAIYSKGKSDSGKVIINSIESSSILGDASLNSDSGYTNSSIMYGLYLDSYVEVKNLERCLVVAKGKSFLSLGDTVTIKAATAVYVGANCTLNMSFDAEAYERDEGNFFASSLPDNSDSAKLFDIMGNVTMTENGGVIAFDLESNLSKTVYNFEGYPCQMLQNK